MNVAIVGYGSIGKRHAKNLTDLGHTFVPVDMHDEMVFDDIEAAFICSPTQHHARHATAYISQGIPTFIEKPITYNLAEVQELSKVAEQFPKVPTMVGCNMRFHPAVSQAKRCVENSSEKVIFVRAEFGFYLPAWRKGDYRRTYSASEFGGVIIDDIHEIDYLFWMFGKFKEIRIVKFNTGALEIKREDIAEVAILFESGVVASVHQDYLVRNYNRRLQLVFEYKKFHYDLLPTNLMYRKQLEYFFRCIEEGEEPMNNVKEACYVTECLLQAKDSGNYSSAAELDEVPA